MSQRETRRWTILIKRACCVSSFHTQMTSFTAKTLFVCFDFFVFAAVFTLSTTRTTTAAATEFTQVAAMAAPCKFLIHSKLTSLQASYTLATLCDWCVGYCSTHRFMLRSGNTTEEVDGEPTATTNTFYSSTIAVRPLCRITHTLLQWCNGGREFLMCIIHHCCARCTDLHIFYSRR